MKKLLATILTLFSVAAFAWQPTKIVSVVVPVAPGSGNEMAFRTLSSIVEKNSAANFIIEHRAGADGNIGMNYFAENTKDDGQMLAVPSCQSTFVASDILYQKIIKYHPMEFSFVTNIGKSPLAFVVNANSPIKTVPQLIEAVTTGNRPINFAVGGAAHLLAYDYFVSKVNANKNVVQSVMYKGPLPAVTDTAAGVAEFAIVPSAVANTLLPTGKIRILGIAGEQTIKKWPSVPLMNKYVQGLNVYACWNIVLKKDTNPEIVKWYVDTFVTAINSPEYIKWATDNLITIDKNVLNPSGVKKDMQNLREQWQPYVARQLAMGIK